MFIDNRSMQLLEAIIQNPQIKNKELEVKFGLSRRQINYAIEKMNQWLVSVQIPPITKSQSGYFILDQQLLTQFRGGEDQKEVRQYILTEKERAILVVLYLLGKTEEASLLHMIDILEVSRNTAIRDIKVAGEMIAPYGIQILYSRLTGYNLVGNEIHIRKLLVEIVQKVLKMFHGEGYFKQVLNLDVSEMAQKIVFLEKTLQIHLTDESYDALPYVIAITLNRIRQHHFIDESFHIDTNELSDTKEYQAVQALVAEYEPFEKSEKIWLTLQLLTSNIRSADLLTDDFIKNMQQGILEMIQQFEERSYISITNKPELMEKLMLHMRPAYYRIKYRLTLKNHFYEQVLKEHRELHKIVKESVTPLEALIGEKFPNSEIVFLTLFFGAQLMSQGEAFHQKKRALVVCSNGLSVSKILKVTLSQIFPEFFFIKSLSLRQFQELQEKNELVYDAVFSTVPLQSSTPTYLVHPVMTTLEKEQLRKRVLKEVDSQVLSGIPMSELLNTIKEHAIVTDEMQMIDSLSSLLQSPISSKLAKNQVPQLPSLNQFIPEDFIQIVEEASDWKEAITLACRPLVLHKMIQPKYVTALIAENNQENLYSFLGKYMAIPHAATEKGVLGSSFAMLILKKPVPFKDGRLVSVITPLAIHHQSNHLKAIEQLSQLAENEQQMLHIMKQEQVAEVKKVLSQYV